MMKQNVVISIAGTQCAPGAAPETVELTTGGTMEQTDGGYQLVYQESELTGMTGTTTTFRVWPGRVILERTGAVESRMEFVEGQSSEALYRIEEGALLLRIRAKKMAVELNPEGGFFDLCYGIDVEDTPMGTVDYHITVRKAPELEP